MGLVPNSGRVPPAGATQAWLGVQASPTSPASVNGSISANSAEKWTQRLIASAAMPFCRAFRVVGAKSIGAEYLQRQVISFR